MEVYVVHDSWVIVGVGAGEGDAFGELDGTVADDLDLYAVRIELCASHWVFEIGHFAFVEGDHFGADKIAVFKH